ncbi:DUF6340 family protein [Rubrolithibacter danxiaensis]|uniref:DUF6340 family protein n=1 Tax=Rubrolithibacter danxiaensis TaxID=3390805 RepID=UPI003BF890C2
MRNLILVLLVPFLSNCRSTNYVTLTVTEPAPVTLPMSMKRIGIINRSLPGSKKPILEKVDEVLTAEGKNLDKDGSVKAMIGLNEELGKNERLTDVQYLAGEKCEASNFGVFPEPLSWDRIAEICTKYQLDGLFSLESYDTDSKINYSTANVLLKNPIGLKVPTIEHQAAAKTIIKTGWRIYDNNSRTIIDEFNMTGNVSMTGKGINPVAAASAITGRKEAVNQESYKLGQSYAWSIEPYKTRVSRIYYVRGNDKFKTAKRRAQTGNWDGAAEMWTRETKNPNAKIAGRALYNMAIIQEIRGNMEGAQDYAKQAYENFDNNRALQYLNVLKNRSKRLERLAYQRQ